MRINLVPLLQIAGLLHLGFIAAGLLMPTIVRMRWHLMTMPPFIRQLFWVYYTFIGFCVAGFSVITIGFASTLAAGGALARVLCAFFALFWTIRLCAGAFVFDMEPYLTTRARRVGYGVLNAAFASLPVIYLLAAARPQWIR
ncbi:MAG TPA: hypothetical protein VFP91_04035 [Vicinamibacterales bacterium]|nr:hypothetical protein [Vicinamibacterales bacterium]